MTTTKQPGFAPAASPHAATAVHTPEEHIIAGETSIPSQGENMPAYHARPKNADGPLPIVIVVQEIFGVHEHIRDLVAAWHRKAIWLSRLNCTSVRAIRMSTTISRPCSKSWSARCRTRRCCGGSRPRRQLGGAPRRRCPSSADHRLLLGRTHYLAVCRA